MADKKEIPAQTYSAVASLPALPTAKSRDLMLSYKDWVYTAVNAIAQDTGAVKLQLHEMLIKPNGEIEIEEKLQHEALSLLHHVNNFMTLPMLLEMTVVYMKLLGEAYWAKLRDNSGKVQELWVLRPDWVKVLPSRENYIEGYIYQPPGVVQKDAARFDVKDIVPFKELNPKDAYRGYSATMAGAMAIDTNHYASNWSRNFFINSALPGLVFTSDKKLNKKTVDRFMTDWLSAFRGTENSHKVAFLGGGMKVDKVTDKMSEMEFRELKKDLRDEILAMYKVPKAVVGITEDVNRANADATLNAYMQRVVSPMALKIVTHLNEFFLNDYNDNEKRKLFFDFEDPAPKDTELELKVYENGIKNYWMTPNEVREKENLPPVEGGDNIFIPTNVLPATAQNEEGDTVQEMRVLPVKKDSKRKKVFHVPLPQKTLAEWKADSIKKEFKHDLHKLVVTMLKNQKDASKVVEMGIQPLFNEETKQEQHDNMVIRVSMYEGRWKDELLKLFDEQRKEVIANLENVKYYAKDKRRGKEASFVFNLAKARELWREVFAPMVLNVYVRELQRTLTQLGLEKEPNTGTETARRFLETEGLKFITDVNTTTIEQLKQTLGEGLSNNESIQQLRDRVNEVFENATQYRAEMIARTEVMRATNSASLEGFRQSGVVTGKEWFTALDERVCPICGPLHGETRELEGSFGEDIGKAPPAHPNCRCVIAPAVAKKQAKKEEEKGMTDHMINRLVDKIVAKEKADEAIEEALQDTAQVTRQIKDEAKAEIDAIKKEATELVASEKEKMAEQLRTIKNKIATIVAERQKENEQKEE